MLLHVTLFLLIRHALGLCADYARSRLTGRPLEPYHTHLSQTLAQTIYFTLGYALSLFL